MRYALWSVGRLLGYTELDLPHVQRRVRMGFIEPTGDGLRLLPDATGVPKVACALARAAKRAAHRRDTDLTELADFRAACDRREALDLELRDEAGLAVRCEWIQIQDIDSVVTVDEDFDVDDDEPMTPELEAAIEHDAELFDSFDESDDYEWNGQESPDERWEMSRYFIMIHLPP